MKKLNYLLLFIGFLIVGESARAQLTCNFSVDTTKGCVPLRINFNDLSTGGGTIVYRNWDFGNGGISNNNNPSPSRVYANSGTYTVKLTVSNGTDTVTKTFTNLITVFENPTANFSFQKLTNCPPINVSFTDGSTIGSAPINSYTWDFGDLTALGRVQNPTHVYPFKGVYSVILSVKDTNGCEGSFEQKNIVVVDKPEANFSVSKRADCQAPMTTVFTNKSTGKGPLSYNWIFGNGSTSSSQSPSHTYTTVGSFDVTLIVTDINGCTDTVFISKLISIGQTVADFTLPDTLCLNQPEKMTNTSLGAQDFLWKFDNNDTSTAVEPFYAFRTGGQKNIKLIGSSGLTCVDSITKSVFVQEIEADYRVSYPDTCDLSIVEFFDSSRISEAISGKYVYTIGTVESSVSGKDTTIKFPSSFCNKTQQQVTYIASNNIGCKDTILKNIVEYSNSKAEISIKSGDHCIDDTLQYFSSGCFLNGASTYKWDLGTGKPDDTSNLKNPTQQIILDSSGIYIVKLIVTDSLGCTYTTKLDYRVGEKPIANFTILDDSLCFKEIFQFKSISTDSAKIDNYNWRLGDNNVASAKSLLHQYDSIGIYNVNLKVNDNGCEDDTTISVYVSGPAVSIQQNNKGLCELPLQQKFILNSIGYYNRFYWDFGDGSPIDSINQSPTHNYAAKGSYRVTVMAINDTSGCTSFNETLIQPVQTKASIYLNSFGCADSIMAFDGSSSVGNLGFNYYWDFDNGKTSTGNRAPKTTFTKDGIYNVRLIVMSVDSCRDTTIMPVYIMPVEPAFSLPPIYNICEGDTLKLNATDSFGVHRINTAGIHRNYYNTISNTFIGNPYNQYFYWKINNIPLNHNNPYLERVFNVNPTKPKIGHQTDTFTLSLSSSDSSYFIHYRLNPLKPERYLYGDFDGCTIDTTVKIVVHQLNPTIRTLDSTICVGDSIWFQDTSQHSISNYIWFFGNGDSSKLSSPKYAYQKGGIYLAKYVTQAKNCVDSFLLPLDVQEIDSLKFYASQTDTNCFPAKTYFFDQSVGDSITWRYWDFGDGNAPIRSPLKDSLTKTFTSPGQFSVKLIVESSYGCQDSITYEKYINIKGPYANFSLSDDSICLYDDILFSVDTFNKYTFNLEWDFSDGRLEKTDTTVKQISNQYTKVGVLNPVLVYSNNLGKCEQAFSTQIVIEQVIANFDLNDSAGCEPHKVAIIDKSIDGNKWNWDFGDKNTATIANPQNEFPTPGSFLIQLIYENTNNECKDTASKKVIVFPSPIVVAKGDTTICRLDSVLLQAFGAKTYTWSPSNNIERATTSSPKVWTTNTQTYIVDGTDSNSCISFDSVLVKVQQVPQIKMPNDTSLIIGEYFTARPIVIDGASYSWKPSQGVECDTCLYSKIEPIKNTVYSLQVTDSLGCFQLTKSFMVEIEEKYSLDVANGFTPNGDGVNDLIFPSGWGIADVIEFKVFNRWGEIVFVSSPEQLGWDGYYKGVLQSQDTYLWFAKIRTISGDEISKEGFFTLFR